MFGCLILFFVRDDSVNAIKRMYTSKVKTGAGGMAANKGSTSIRFNYEDTSLMFLNCHLTSGQKQVTERFNDLQLCY
jgi:phosphatidylinositol-3,4,5-trisphosphate 5-phosphatase 2